MCCRAVIGECNREIVQLREPDEAGEILVACGREPKLLEVFEAGDIERRVARDLPFETVACIENFQIGQAVECVQAGNRNADVSEVEPLEVVESGQFRKPPVRDFRAAVRA